jgi:beta-glucosidase
MKTLFTSLVLVFIAPLFLFAQKVSSEQQIDSLIVRMTLEEKAGQLSQFSGGWNNGSTNSTVTAEQRTMVKEGKVGSFLNVFGSEITRELQCIAVEESRMKIPLLYGFDVIHGFRTTFPIPLAEASSWDPSAVEKADRIAATEAAAAGIHWTFAPMVDIARDPRWGRIAEGSGEDPYLGSVMARAHVKGFQGENGSGGDAILACVKHYAAYGGAEGGRDYNTVDISERSLRETYLPPFKAALDAGVATFMSSFNEIAGVPSTGNRMLLTDILRREWGFKGFVVSDWTSIPEMRAHGIAATDEEAGMLAVTAGTDMDMVGGVYLRYLPALVREGKVSEQTVNEAVRRVLRVKFQLGLFDDPYRYCNAEKERTLIYNDANRAAARAMARRSIVLLKNGRNVLPLKKDIRSIALIGPLADDHENPLGPWAQVGRPSDVVTVLEGLKTVAAPSCKITYVRGCEVVDSLPKRDFTKVLTAANGADVVIMVLGESSDMTGEAASRSNLDLPGEQEGLLRAVCAIGKPVVLVLMNGRPLTLPWAADHCDAIVESWFLGVQTGNAIADVVFGDYNPSGKLPVSFPRAVGEVPVYYNYKNTGRPTNSYNRFTSKYIDAPSTPLYPFGFGLSYTTFSYKDLALSSKKIGTDGIVRVTVNVTNSGNRYGEETVQMYIRDVAGSVTRPVKELRGFKKIALKPGETKSVEFALEPNDLAMYNREMKWVVEPGSFKVFVGTNSAENLEDEFEVVQKQ